MLGTFRVCWVRVMKQVWGGLSRGLLGWFEKERDCPPCRHHTSTACFCSTVPFYSPTIFFILIVIMLHFFLFTPKHSETCRTCEDLCCKSPVLPLGSTDTWAAAPHTGVPHYANAFSPLPFFFPSLWSTLALVSHDVFDVISSFLNKETQCQKKKRGNLSSKNTWKILK